MEKTCYLDNEIIALVDCNNFYASCERVFNPRLQNIPVAVLSNNDGCIVSRSNEIKALGVPMGAPGFKYEAMIRKGRRSAAFLKLLPLWRYERARDGSLARV